MPVLNPMRKNILLVLVSSCTVIILCAAVMEIYGRVQYNRWRESYTGFGWVKTLIVKSQDPILMWENRPSGETIFYNIPFKMNRYGFRGADVPKVKPPDRQRVALIGDSVTMGLYNKNEDTIASQLELALNREKKLASTPFEVLNFGVAGYNTLQIGELLRVRVLDFLPDVVVYIYCANDFDLDLDSSDIFKQPTGFFARSLKKAWRMLLRSEYHHLHFNNNRDVVYKEILSMRDAIAQKKKRFLVVMVPIFQVQGSSFDPYPLNDIDENVERFLNSNTIKYVNLLNDFRATGQPPGALACDVWHPNREGNRIIAAALVQPVLDALKGSP